MQVFSKLYIRLATIALFVLLAFLVVGSLQKGYAAVACLLFHDTGNPELDGQCVTTPKCSTCSDNGHDSLGKSCVRDSDCTCKPGQFAVCMKPAIGITTEGECKGEPACLAALAAANLAILGGTGAYVQQVDDGSYMVICLNGAIYSTKWYPTPSVTPTPTKVPTPTPVPPSPTPTPRPFNPNACTCDGIEYDTLQPGAQATVTSFAKVDGEETQYARVVSQTFKFLSSPNDSSLESTIVMPFVTIPSTVSSNTPGLTRFKSSWTFTVPQLESGRTYRIMTQLDCQPKTTTMSTSQVMGAQDQSLFEKLVNFFGRVVGIKPKATPTPTQEKVLGTTSNTANTNLQLGSFTPVEVYLKACDIIRFRVGT